MAGQWIAARDVPAWASLALLPVCRGLCDYDALQAALVGVPGIRVHAIFLGTTRGAADGGLRAVAPTVVCRFVAGHRLLSVLVENLLPTVKEEGRAASDVTEAVELSPTSAALFPPAPQEEMDVEDDSAHHIKQEEEETGVADDSTPSGVPLAIKREELGLSDEGTQAAQDQPPALKDDEQEDCPPLKRRRKEESAKAEAL